MDGELEVEQGAIEGERMDGELDEGQGRGRGRERKRAGGR